MNVIFDTGSANLWLISSECKSLSCIRLKKSSYNHDKSTTYNDIDYDFEVKEIPYLKLGIIWNR